MSLPRPDEHEPHESVFRNLSRREFTASATAFVVGMFLVPGSAGADRSVAGFATTPGGEVTPHLFITIEADESVKLVCHRSEMGQQIWTSLAQILVEELDVSWDRVQVVQAEGHPRYGNQNTDGSRSIRTNFERFRTMGAAMRAMLVQAAASQWGVPVGQCRVEAGVVHHTSGKQATYGSLAAAAAKMDLPDPRDVKPKPRAEWKSIAKPVKSLITPDIVHGRGVYGQDVSLGGMLVAVIAHPPQVLATIKSLDATKALAIDGVEQVVRLPDPKPPLKFQPLGGVAVVARDTWSAMKGREALEIEWNPGPNANYDSAKFAEQLFATARERGKVRRNRGDVYRALEGAATRVEAEYYMPHIAHSSMEPPAALARWDGDKVWCKGCTQTPQAARTTVAEICGVPPDNVTIEVSWLGGGFGRKSKPDFFAEAALIAREVGAPVKVVWTREDATQHSYFHTVSAQRLEAALDDSGKCTAFLHRTVFPPISSTFTDGATEPSDGDMRQGASDTPFDVPNLRLESGEAPAHVRIGWLRSVANIYHAFAVQSFAAELAHAAGKDQKDYLLELIGPPRKIDPNKEGANYDNYGSSMDDYPIDTGRMSALVRQVAKMANWGRALPAGHGLGIAVHRSFASYVATVVEVAVDGEGRLTIPEVWSAIDAGTIVNPNHVRAQVEGGTLFGLSNALYGQITARGGVIEQANFPDWRLMRMNEAPRKMSVEIVESTAAPGGVGEPPTPPAAPALANAIFAATGLRIRKLPIFDDSRRDRLPVKEGAP